ncbi:hypothetical protein [Micromonospora sp. bgisy143]|uniref:hypothetical protein n=1 Tax=Micromonospora sp. bgisy143 TaxID=3413790 RepID=UPI003EB941A4
MAAVTRFTAGDVVLIGPECSVQFGGDRVLRVRLVSIGAADPYHGWVWLTGYVLDAKGLAIDKREVYVRSAGIAVCTAGSAGRQAPRVASHTRRAGKPHPATVIRL